jgi:lipopolysaccharide/colanic/teichoic acid biosynthesis glycosyltransferase
MSLTFPRVMTLAVTLTSEAFAAVLPSFRSERRAQERRQEDEELVGDRVLRVEPKRVDPRAAAAKRGLDVMGSACALLVLAPLLPMLWVLMRLTDKGPLFYSQVRLGRGAVPFRIFKIRTMVADADKLKFLLADRNEQSGPMFKMERDPRVTHLGRFLRKYSIDELPQLWNVLRGDMSLVGPRPSLPEEVRKFRMWQTERLAVRPGLTCIWQVSGRNRVGFEDWMRMDMRYLNQWSLGLDLALLARTVRVVVRAEGAA